ncbi:MAG TPA: pyruvate, phosphate dikinase [Verrucomicrobia bacterium]|nr:MAG: pyruvate, phosphate dikinase [Lentisphaerae bacterium GWF2_57_35]HBA85419.1 pyruvate, phosphate dikinase [Verrucomicrobiota bacterium]
MSDKLQNEASSLTTGLPGLDQVLKGVMPGDNIVWQVESTDDYLALVKPYAAAARASDRKLIYFRFATHPQLLPDDFGAEIHRPRPELGFESFTTEVHQVIGEAGRGAIYVFDCLSELASTWCSDQMLGNFFMLTCPRLLDLETVTYFAIYRNYHASFALRPITETTQFLLDVFRHEDHLYIRPIKVQYRSTSAMNMIHAWEGDEFKPVTASAIVSKLLVSSRWPGLRTDNRRGFWRRIFSEAETLYEQIKAGQCPPEVERDLFERLSRMVLSHDEGMLKLISRYLTLEDIFSIHDRMIGIGLIGGKAVGMLIARAILQKTEPKFRDLLETHDSFFIGSDVFYTFLVRNKIWWIRQKQQDPETFLEGAAEARELIMKGVFPDYTVEQFREMLDYFGESPFIVRSSSLLEDNYGNAFAGKYDSVFCVNQGSREKRLEEFLQAVREIYASTLSEKALRYRAQRNMLDRDEQMALLVMRVSGSIQGKKFYPQVAGVGFSFNPYAWNEYIDPKAGVVRLVFGLGTRAVDRADDDYTRLVALNAPERRPEANFDEVCQYAQRRVDYLDLQSNQLTSGYFSDLLEEPSDFPLDLFASQEASHDGNSDPTHRILTFDELLSSTDFVDRLREMLRLLHEAYQYPVDIEFAANFLNEKHYTINLLQCRPLQVQGAEVIRVPEVDIRDEDRILEAHGAVIGQGRILDIDRFIYVVPSAYGALPIQARYEVAHLIGKINRLAPADDASITMLLGPGRWGTSSPSLGIPVNFGEISRVSILCEIVAMRENLIPDVSLGTHFLNELVEMNMLYIALFPRQKKNILHEAFFLKAPNRLAELVPEAASWADTVKVIDVREAAAQDRVVTLSANAVEQKAVCYFRVPSAEASSFIKNHKEK